MPRSTWQQLPARVRTALEREAGTVTAVDYPSAGRNSDFSATLHTESGPVFCKGVADARSPRGNAHRHEADINPWLPSAVAPRLRWRTESDGWLLLGFDHVPGGHADLTPGSPDLEAVASTMRCLVDGLAHFSGQAPCLAEQWERLAAWRRLAVEFGMDEWTADHLEQLIEWERRAVEEADGDSLIHTDLHSLNLLVHERHATAVDWAWSRRGAATVDVAFLVARLVSAGHQPDHAEDWAAALPAWRQLTAETRTAFAVAIWGIWTLLSSRRPAKVWDTLVPAARAWARHRLSAH